MIHWSNLILSYPTLLTPFGNYLSIQRTFSGHFASISFIITFCCPPLGQICCHDGCPLGFLGQIRIIFPSLLLFLPLLTYICGKTESIFPSNASLPGPKSPMRAEAHTPTDDGYGQMWSAEPRGNSSEWPSSHLAILRPLPFPPLHSYNSPSLGLFWPFN